MTPDWTKPKIDEQQLGQFSDKPNKPKEVNGPKGLEPTRVIGNEKEYVTISRREKCPTYLQSK